MTSTMLGELSRLFHAEGRKAPTASSQIRLHAIAEDIRQRQMAHSVGAIPTPYELGQQLAQNLGLGPTSGDTSPTTPTVPNPLGGLQGSLANIANQVKEQGAQASGSAEQAGTQAQAAAQSVNTMLLAVAVGIGLVIILTRK